jgi:hypothetical protein
MSTLTEDASAAAARAGRALDEVRQAARPWFRVYARIGYAAKGLVHLLVGGLALAAAMGDASGRVTDAAGALRELARRPFGRPVLVLVGIGLFGYALLRLVQGGLDPARRPRTLRFALTRTGEVLSGAGYLLLVWGAFRLVSGAGAPSTGDMHARTLTREAMQMPFGVGLMGVAAVILFAVGIWFLVRALLIQNVCADLAVEKLGRRGCTVAALFIRVGAGAQGVLFGLVGYLLFRAAESQDPQQARGMDGVLRVVERYGEGLLALVAGGLIAVGVSAFIEARWRRL